MWNRNPLPGHLGLLSASVTGLYSWSSPAIHALPKRIRVSWCCGGGAIGDFILTLPVLQNLRERWPHAYIELIGYPHIANLALAAGWVDHVSSLDRAEMARFFTPYPSFSDGQAGHIQSFDLVFCYLHDPGGVVCENLKSAGAKQVIYGSPLVTAGHASAFLMRPLQTLAIYDDGRKPALPLPGPEKRRGREWLQQRLIRPPVLLIHPGSGSPQKNWPPERFAEVARCFSGKGFSILLVLGEADGNAEAFFVRHCPQFPVLKGGTLLEVASIMTACQGFVGNDSGVSHLAAAIGVPSVLLFGPTDPAIWAPRNSNVHVLRASDNLLDSLATGVVCAALEAALSAAWDINKE